MSNHVHPQLARDSYVGTGAALNIRLGFKPSILFVYNETDGTTCWFAIDGLADGSALQIDTAVSLISSNGITLSRSGFSVGTSLSTSGKTFRYFAF